jgi:hypothetical protein
MGYQIESMLINFETTNVTLIVVKTTEQLSVYFFGYL